MAGRKEGRSVLFNDTLNTFYLRLYGVGYMVKDHSDSERGNPLPPHGLHLAPEDGNARPHAAVLVRSFCSTTMSTHYFGLSVCRIESE